MENGETSRDLQSRPWQSYNTVYTNAKAGMEGVDKEKVQRIVYEMSKGSKYFQNEERKEALIKQKIEHMRDRSAKLTSADISYYQKVVDKRILELEAARDLSRIWLHVDMDAFYAAVETLSNPSLKGKPMAVGSLSMLSTANYEARKFGVRAAMPGFIARKLCPDLIIVPTDFTKYIHYSDLTRKVFRNYDPNFIAGSLDEAYLDITEVCRERGLSGGISIAEELRSSVFAETGLTCSAGVAPNRLLAKVCSDINKPNGQFVLPNDRAAVMTFISSLPIRKIGGIGKVTEHVLKDALGIKTCEEMVQKGSLIYALFSRSTADFFLCVGLGLGKTDTPETRSRKSISNERTFAATGNETLIYRKLVEIAEMLSDEMKKEGLSAKTLTLKLKTASFEIRTRAVSLQKYICSSEDILKHASILLKAELPISIRLIGLRMSQFNGENSDPSQKSITSFINPTSSSKPNLDDHNLMDLNASSSCLNPSFDIHDTSNEQSKVPVESEETRVLSDNCCTSAKDADELYPIQEDIRNDENDMGHTVNDVYVVPLSREGERLKVLEADALLEKHEECEPDTMDGKYLALQKEAASTSRSIEPIFWIDGYKCSVCGSELPPNFIEERQEHIDFHLAEKLQEEESVLSSSSTPMTKRRVMKEAKRSKVKKQKQATRDSNHIPIHAFFAKSCQNF